MNLKKIIGERIALARKANGLTIKVLAERTNLGATRIGNWEQGTRSPGPEAAMILSKELQVAASWLLAITNDPKGERVQHVIHGLFEQSTI